MVGEGAVSLCKDRNLHVLLTTLPEVSVSVPIAAHIEGKRPGGRYYLYTGSLGQLIRLPTDQGRTLQAPFVFGRDTWPGRTTKKALCGRRRRRKTNLHKRPD